MQITQNYFNGLDLREILTSPKDEKKLSKSTLITLGFSEEEFETICEALDVLIRLNAEPISSDQVLEVISAAVPTNTRALAKLKFYFAELNRFTQASQDPNFISGCAIKIAEETYHLASASFMGPTRLLSQNSDASTGINYTANSKIVTAIADGLTGHETDQIHERTLHAGQIAANAAIKSLGNNQNLLEDFSDTSIRNFIEKISKDIAEELKSRARDRLIDLSKIEISASTLAFAIDAGDDFILVSVGDSTIFAFDENGIIEKTLNEMHRCPIENNLSSTVGASVSVDPDTQKQTVNPIKPRYISIVRINKSKIRGLMLCTDGILRNHNPATIELFNQAVIQASMDSDDARSLVSRAFEFADKQNSGDDRTGTAIIKQPAI